MNKRLLQFLAAENITQAQLADTIEVARASISHILSGRNKPSFDFIQRIGQHYPELNLEWLITGTGKMYKGSSHSPIVNQPEQNESEITLFQEEISSFNTADNTPQSPINEPIKQAKPAKDNPRKQSISTQVLPVATNRKISKIVVFFDDNTFQELSSI